MNIVAEEPGISVTRPDAIIADAPQYHKISTGAYHVTRGGAAGQTRAGQVR